MRWRRNIILILNMETKTNLNRLLKRMRSLATEKVGHNMTQCVILNLKITTCMFKKRAWIIIRLNRVGLSPMTLKVTKLGKRNIHSLSLINNQITKKKR